MDLSALQELVEANIHDMIDALRLWEWNIEVSYGRLGGDRGANQGVAGECTVFPEYRRAVITLDGEYIEDADTALQCLRHELLHIFVWPFHNFGDWAQKKSGGMLADEDFHVYQFYLERMIGDIERLLDGDAGTFRPKGRHGHDEPTEL